MPSGGSEAVHARSPCCAAQHPHSKTTSKLIHQATLKLISTPRLHGLIQLERIDLKLGSPTPLPGHRPLGVRPAKLVINEVPGPCFMDKGSSLTCQHPLMQGFWKPGCLRSEESDPCAAMPSNQDCSVVIHLIEVPTLMIWRQVVESGGFTSRSCTFGL